MVVFIFRLLSVLSVFRSCRSTTHRRQHNTTNIITCMLLEYFIEIINFQIESRGVFRSNSIMDKGSAGVSDNNDMSMETEETDKAGEDHDRGEPIPELVRG